MSWPVHCRWSWSRRARWRESGLVDACLATAPSGAVVVFGCLIAGFHCALGVARCFHASRRTACLHVARGNGESVFVSGSCVIACGWLPGSRLTTDPTAADVMDSSGRVGFQTTALNNSTSGNARKTSNPAFDVPWPPTHRRGSAGAGMRDRRKHGCFLRAPMDGFTACPAYPHPPAQLGPCKGHPLFAQIHRQPGSARRRIA